MSFSPPLSTSNWIKEYFSLRDYPPQHLIKHCRIRFDKDGIVTAYYDRALGYRYNTVTVSHYALACYDQVKSHGRRQFEEKFFQQILYLKTRYVVIDEEKYGYPYDMQERLYKLPPPWYSGMAQGEAISALIIAYYFLPD